RYRGHSMSDPGKYRTRDEVNRMRQEHDCIESAKAKLLGMGADEAELKAIEDDVRRRIADAAEFAQSSPEPDPKELWTDVLVEG
ncbi:MAG: pyruvate dehydrogenase (acetyl-transferring) E1 component subunit alpha, partial [Acidisphaera sp.]|nr:pyruvate dehydrogenase (acetyl-transferring) E1 component subunit alpha [Acidisphaera sp.]